MANNPTVNKVIYGNDTLIDLTEDDVTAGDVVAGKYFHAPSGVRTVGTAVIPEPATATPLMDGTAAVGTATKYAREDHRHPKDTNAYRFGQTVSNKRTGGTNDPPYYVSFNNNKKTLDFPSLIRAVGGVGDHFYSAYNNPDMTVTCNYSGIAMSTLFSPAASSTILIPVEDLSTNPFTITVEKTSNGNITATDVTHITLFEHTLNTTAARLTDYKLEILTTGSTASTGDYSWQTVYERNNVSDIINGLTMPMNDTSYSYLYFRGVRFTVSGATPIQTTSPSGWGYNKFDLALFCLFDTRPAFSAARSLGALDIHGGEVFGTVKFDQSVTMRSGYYFNGNLNGNATSATSANTATTATTATKVSAIAGTANADRHVWFSDSSYEVNRNYDDDFKYNPSTNTLTVSNVTGNAATATTATKATQDESGNNIKASYGASLDISGTTLSLKNQNGTALNSVTIPSELPAVTSTDNGKILQVASGAWSAQTMPTELPSVTSTDNGKVLTVVSGAWAAATGGGSSPSPATANPLMDGTAAVGTSDKYAREDHVHPSDTTKANLASPALTGTPTAPTATAGTSTTQIATTAFVGTAVSGKQDTISDLATIRSNATDGETAFVRSTNKVLYLTSVAVSAGDGNIATVSNANITADHVVAELVFANPNWIYSEITWTTASGSLTLNGKCYSATTANIVLIKKDNS